MKTSVKMQTIVTALAETHAVDLTVPDAYLELRLAGYMPLCIERPSPAEVAVYHYYEEGGVKYCDPEVTFFILWEQWVPIAYRQDNLGVQAVYASVTPDGSHVEVLDWTRQADLATFTETWARNLKNQGWLERAEPHEAGCSAGALPRPDWQTLERWMWEDGGCEAACEHTCWVEPDGHCPHGKPSWFLKLGLI